MGDKGKSGPAAEHNWSDTASEDQPDSPARTRQSDHEYHEISDEDEPLPKVEVRKACGNGDGICNFFVVVVVDLNHIFS